MGFSFTLPEQLTTMNLDKNFIYSAIWASSTMQSFKHSFHVWARLIHIKFLYSWPLWDDFAMLTFQTQIKDIFMERKREKASCDILPMWKPHNLVANRSTLG